MGGQAPQAESGHRFADWAGIRLELLWAYDGAVDPSWRRARSGATHEWSAWLLRQGRAEVTTPDGQSIALLPGRWLIRWHDAETEQSFSEDARLLSIRFRLDRPDGICFFEEPACFVDPEARPALETAAGRLVNLTRARFKERFELWRQPASFETYLRAQKYLAQWAAVFVDAVAAAGNGPRSLTPSDDRLQRAIALLNGTRLADGLPAERLRRDTGLTLRQIDRLMVSALGMTCHQYLDQRRVQLAKDSLLAHATPIKAIAFDLGFRQLSHFSAWFRRHTGASPRHFRLAVGHVVQPSRRRARPAARRNGAPIRGGRASRSTSV